MHARKDFVIGSWVVLSKGDISPVILLGGIGLVLLGLFAWHLRRRERAGGEPLIPLRLFSDRTVVLGLVTQNIQWLLMIGPSSSSPSSFR